MDEEVKSALRDAMERVLGSLPPHPAPPSELYLIWRRRGISGWIGSFEERSTTPFALLSAIDWAGESADLAQLLRNHHPQYVGMVGTSITGLQSFQASDLLRIAVSLIWERQGSFVVDRKAISEIVEEVAQFVDSPSILLEYLVPLLSFRMDQTSPLPLAGGLGIRQLTEEEVTQLYGGWCFTSVGLLPSP